MFYTIFSWFTITCKKEQCTSIGTATKNLIMNLTDLLFCQLDMVSSITNICDSNKVYMCQ